MDGKVWGFRIIDVLLSTRINIFADFEGKCYDTRTISIPLTIIWDVMNVASKLK